MQINAADGTCRDCTGGTKPNKEKTKCMISFCGPTAPYLVDGKCTDNRGKVTVEGGGGPKPARPVVEDEEKEKETEEEPEEEWPEEEEEPPVVEEEPEPEPEEEEEDWGDEDWEDFAELESFLI